MSTDSETKKHHPHARLCHVIKSENFDGYGFNLHAEKGKPGQYIGKVDDGSPAELAGLRQGDRILEVNGVSITNETHKQVVQRIKAQTNETKLLVIDPEDELNDNHDGNNGSVNIATDTNSNASSKTTSDATTASANNGQVHTDNNTNNTNNHGNSKHDSLNLSMSVAEMRAILASKKKFDPRKEPIDFKKKFDTVQKL